MEPQKYINFLGEHYSELNNKKTGSRGYVIWMHSNSLRYSAGIIEAENSKDGKIRDLNKTDEKVIEALSAAIKARLPIGAALYACSETPWMGRQQYREFLNIFSFSKEFVNELIIHSGREAKLFTMERDKSILEIMKPVTDLTGIVRKEALTEELASEIEKQGRWFLDRMRM